MTVQQNSAPAVVTAPSAPVAPSRLPLAAGCLALSSLVIAVLVLWAPWGKRNAWSYADVAPHRDAAWNALVLDAVAFVGIAVSFAVVVCLLTPGRGRTLASIGSLLAVVGGALAAAGELSSATLFWYATSAGVSKQDGTALLVWAHHHAGHTYGADAAGFLLFTLGSLVLAVALIRARALPRAAPVAFIVFSLAQFVGAGRLQDVSETATMLSLAAIAVLALRGAAHPKG
jgi:hypothetical protein